jgi:hypothetical protein
MVMLFIYCMIPRKMHLVGARVHERYNQFLKSEKKRPLGVARTKKVSSSKEPKRSWYHEMDTIYVHILVKFERRLSVQFGRKKEKQNVFHKHGPTLYFVKNALFLRTEMDNLHSNLTGIRTYIVSIA